MGKIYLVDCEEKPEVDVRILSSGRTDCVGYGYVFIYWQELTEKRRNPQKHQATGRYNGNKRTSLPGVLTHDNVSVSGPASKLITE